MGDAIKAVQEKLDDMRASVDKFVDSQPAYVKPIFKGVAAALPAMAFGVLLGKLNSSAMELNKDNPAAANNPLMQSQLQAMEQMGSSNPLRFAANIGALMFAQTAVTEYSKLQRGTGDEDMWNTVVGSAASGVVFSVVSALGTPRGPTIDAALGTGAMFGVFNAAFFKIGQAFKGGDKKAKDEDYVRTSHMLRSLGLEQYERNFRQGQLDDKCLLLLTDTALAEVRIPPGPRLLILNTTAAYRQYYAQGRGAQGAGAGAGAGQQRPPQPPPGQTWVAPMPGQGGAGAGAGAGRGGWREGGVLN